MNESSNCELSLFKNYTSRSPVTSSLSQVVSLIRGDAGDTSEMLRLLTETYRRTGDKQFKMSCPLFAVACRFKDGKGLANINGITGLSLVDFDHIEGGVPPDSPILPKIRNDPHTLLCYRTISGCGLRVVFSYSLDTSFAQDKQQQFYPKAFAAGNAYYERLTALAADRQCKNITRLSGLAHDPEVFYNPHASPFTADEIAACCQAGEEHDKIQQQTERIDRYYEGVLKPWLKSEGIVYGPGTHNNYVMRVGYKLAEKRYAKDAAIRWAVNEFSDYADTAQVMASCFANVSDRNKFRTTTAKVGDKYAGVEDIRNFLDGHAKLRYNVITRRIESLDNGKWDALTDRTVNTLWTNMSMAQRVSKPDMLNVIESDYVPEFNPFKSYLESLPPWHDGDHDYIADLSATLAMSKASRRVFGESFRKWFVAMVASWMGANTVNNVILVLIGKQGAYKTTWFNYLLPPTLRRYFYTKTNSGRMGKDDLLTLAEYGLVCYEELDTMQPAELNQLKAAVTMTYIDERAAYARYKEHRPHIASFCGTGNNTQFLSDPTGNRRWLPVQVSSIRSPRDHPFPYEGMYAQAFALYNEGFTYWFSSSEIQKLNRHNKQFETPRPEQELVSLYFRKPVPPEHGIFVTATRALQLIGSNVAQKLSAVYVGRAFSELGFERCKSGGNYGYIAIPCSSEELQQKEKLLGMNAKPADYEENTKDEDKPNDNGKDKAKGYDDMPGDG